MALKKWGVLVVILLAACDGSVRREGPPVPLLQVTRVDVQGNRVWVLDEAGLAVYDRTNRRLLRRVALPDWVLAGPGDACAPDLVLEPSGAAVVSSNVVPVLWRVDPQRFDARPIALKLDRDADKDVGFSRLSLAADGSLLAAGSTFASRWRIDLRAATATRLDDAGETVRCQEAT